MRSHRAAAGGILLAISCCTVSHAQDISAKITGTVTDPAGAVVPNATVTATETSQGITHDTKTNAAGVYFLPALQPGTYSLTIEAQGFAKQERPAFALILNQVARIDVAMTVGQEAQTVKVTGETPLLETDASYLGTNIDAHANVTLPLATRNYNQLTLLSPGAVSTNQGSFAQAQNSFGAGRPYINGNREQTNNYILDGTDNNQIDNNDAAFSPNVDAIQETNLVSQNAPASYGNFLGGIITVTLKSGSNKFHGTAFEFIRNDALNANTWQNGLTRGQAFVPGQNNPDGSGVKPALRFNQFGGTLGGPIFKDKLFFFADYQGTRFDQPATRAPFTTITAAERQGDFSSVCANNNFTAAGICNNLAQQLYNPFSADTPAGRQPFLFNRIPANLFSPAAAAILASPLYPAPLNGQNTLNQINSVQTSTSTDQGDFRLDYGGNEANKYYLRYSQQNITNPTTNSQQLIADSLATFPLYNAVLDWDHTFSPSLLNTARIGGSYFPVTFGNTNPTGQNLPSVFGIAGATPGQTFLPAQLFQGPTYGPQLGSSNLVQNYHDTVIEPQDQVTWVKGKQTFNFGFEFFYYKRNDTYPGNSGLAGTFGYDGSYTSNGTAASLGWSEADFLLGLPENSGLGNGGGRSVRNRLYAAYAQDDWRIRPNLTINAGLRWELQTPAFEAGNQSTNYNLQTGAVEIAGLNGNSQALYNTYYGPTDFQPRVGFAWQPGGNPRLVFRGAYGISNFSESTGTGNLLFQNPPFAIPVSTNSPGRTNARPGTTLDQGFSSFPTSGCTVAGALAYSAACFAGTGIHAFDPNFRPAVSQQYNLTAQFQLTNTSTFQISYVGQKDDHLAAIALINQGVLNGNGTVSPSPYLNPTLFSVLGAGTQARLTESTGFSNYNSLQTSFQQRLTQGVEFQANYTWSKCLSNSSGFFAEFGDSNSGVTQAGNNHFFFQNTYDPRADYGRCDQNVANDANGYLTYALPVGKGQRFGQHLNRAVDEAVGGWQANAIYTLHGGFPITPQASDASGTNSGFSRANCPSQPVILGKGVPTTAGVPGYQFLSSAGVTQPANGTFGNCQVGAFTGPGLQQFDASVFKSFTVVEGQNIQFRAEAINVLNHPILTAPNSSLGSTFGVINNAQGERNLQFALKYIF